MQAAAQSLEEKLQAAEFENVRLRAQVSTLQGLLAESSGRTINQGVKPCVDCHKPVRTLAKFCPHCGHAVKPGNPCKKCGVALPPDAKFCPACAEPCPHCEGPVEAAPVLLFMVPPPAGAATLAAAAAGIGNPIEEVKVPGGAAAATVGAPIRTYERKLTPMEALACARQIHAAMAGAGTRDKQLVEALVDKTDPELLQVRAAWDEHIKRDMIADIKADTSGDYEHTLVALATPQAFLDAQYIDAATKGMLTDHKLLCEVMCTRTHAELEACARAFLLLPDRKGETLAHCIGKATSGDLKKLYLHLLDEKRASCPPDAQAEKDAATLYAAGEKRWGTDEMTFIKILTSSPREYVMKVAEAYPKANPKMHTLIQAIKGETSGDFKRALIALCTPEPEYWAEQLYKSMKGLGTNEKLLTRVLVTQRGPGMRAITTAFFAKYGKSLEEWIRDDTSGDYKMALCAIVQAWNKPACRVCGNLY